MHMYPLSLYLPCGRDARTDLPAACHHRRGREISTSSSSLPQLTSRIIITKMAHVCGYADQSSVSVIGFTITTLLLALKKTATNPKDTKH